MVLGVPRVKELIGASDNMATPCMTLVLKPVIARSLVAAEALSRGLPFTLLRDVVAAALLIYESDLVQTHVAEDRGIVRAHRPFLASLRDRNASNWVIRIVLDRTAATARSLEPRGLADIIQQEMQSNSLVIASTVDDEDWVIRVYMLDLDDEINDTMRKSTAKKVKPRKRKSTTSGSITSRKRRKFADLTDFCSGENTIPIPLHSLYPQIDRTVHSVGDVVQWMVVRNLKDDLMNGLRVCGVSGITDATLREVRSTRVDPATQGVTTEVEWVIDVCGTNLMRMMALHAVDSTMVVSNNVREVERELGIDAAAHVLFQELRECLCSDGARVDDRYIELLVDFMTHRGSVMAMSRHGLNRIREHGVLEKVTFEETLEMLFDAAAAGEFDDIRGVSEKIMLGQRIRVGTGLCEIYGNVDGHRVHIGGTTQAPAEREDLRVMCSVVTEPGGLDLEITREVTAGHDDMVERALVGNVTTQKVTSAVGTGASVVDMQLYEHHMFEEAPPIVDEADVLIDPPFHPSSPFMFISMEDVDAQPFHPSSPSQFM
jgi:DNA-directed RNA polymerase II subunit RPB1